MAWSRFKVGLLVDLTHPSRPSILVVYLNDNIVRFYGSGFYQLASLDLPTNGEVFLHFLFLFTIKFLVSRMFHGSGFLIF